MTSTEGQSSDSLTVLGDRDWASLVPLYVKFQTLVALASFSPEEREGVGTMEMISKEF